MNRFQNAIHRFTSRIVFRVARAVLLAILAAMTLTPSFAQVSVSPQAVARIDRGFYYSADGALLHVEVVRTVAGRNIEPLPAGFALPNALPQTPPDAGASAVLIGGAASYVVYFGPDAQSVALRGNKVNAVPVAYERLREGDSTRPIECAVKGESFCRYPKMCHCAQVGECCCY